MAGERGHEALGQAPVVVEAGGAAQLLDHVAHVGAVVGGVVVALAQCLEHSQFAHLLVAQQWVEAYAVDVALQVFVFHPVDQPPQRYAAGAHRDALAGEGQEEAHVLFVVVAYRLVGDILCDEALARSEAHVELHLGQRVFGIAAHEVVAGVAAHGHQQGVEVSAAGVELGVEVHAVGHHKAVHRVVEGRQAQVQLVVGQVEEFDRQRLGVEEYVALLVNQPVELGYVYHIAPARLYVERLAVVLHLQEHQPGVVHIAGQLEGAGAVYFGGVLDVLGHRQHIGVAV